MPVETLQGAGQGISVGFMNTDKGDRPCLKDTLDLFVALILSLKLSVHWHFLSFFPNSFTTDEAIAALATLKLSHSYWGPDSRGSSHTLTTTTSTKLSMTREKAKGICQQFMNARLIENAADSGSNVFKERGIFVLTPKGLHILDRFIVNNEISPGALAKVFSSQPVGSKLVYLERRASDDEIIVSQAVITHLFRCFAGRRPNYMDYTSVALDPCPVEEYHERSKGIPLMDVSGRKLRRRDVKMLYCCFRAVPALEWLLDYTYIRDRDEAAEMAAHFVRFGLIALVSDKRKADDSAVIFTVRGSVPNGDPTVSQYGEFRCTSKDIYRITPNGRHVAGWDMPSVNYGSDIALTSYTSKDSISSTDREEETGVTVPANGVKFDSITEASSEPSPALSKRNFETRKVVESGADTLKYILDEPALLSLFRDFLRSNLRENNLSFWLEVRDFKRKSNLVSNSTSTGVQITGGSTLRQTMTSKRHNDLIQTALLIYNNYLAPSSQRELNIDYALRRELTSYIGQVMMEVKGETSNGRVEPEASTALSTAQLQTITRFYDRIQTHVFHSMSTESVPEFIKTKEFRALRAWVEDDECSDGQSLDQSR